ncbi:MAG: hypothetical protein J7J32_06605 [Candidatus Atribacteria bacterium]|nr:hypothetical protein [Candidatus Atribacteria bacterium]MCD6350326.1 hypothetical protein [Candidatus Atribacteria bacterium]
MDLALRIQDIIGLVLAVLIVAILISIVLILRESARERRMWEESEEEDIFSPPRKRSSKKPISDEVSGSEQPTSVSGWKGKILKELEARKGWNALSRSGSRKEEALKEKTSDSETAFQPPAEEEVSIPLKKDELSEKEKVQVPLEEPIEKPEPPQVVLERALKKLQDLGLDIKEIQPLLDKESIVFSPLLWEVKEEIRSGKEVGNIVVHTVFKTLPGYSGEEVVEMYRSGNLSVVEKMEARIRTAEGREFLVATLGLEYFRVPDLEKAFYEGHLAEKEYELLRALKFVDRNTKKDFARVVYKEIISEEE